MSAVRWLAALAGAVLALVAGHVISEEIRARLERLPFLLLRLARALCVPAPDPDPAGPPLGRDRPSWSRRSRWRRRTHWRPAQTAAVEFTEVIKRRRMVHAFTDEPLGPGTAERLLRAANRAPSAGFSQGYSSQRHRPTADAARRPSPPTG